MAAVMFIYNWKKHSLLVFMEVSLASFLFGSDGMICELQGVLFFDKMTDQVLDSILEELKVSRTVAG